MLSTVKQERRASLRVLVVNRFGSACREMLNRRDVELGWSLTPEEATHAMRFNRPDLVLVDERDAETILAHRQAEQEVIVFLGSAKAEMKHCYAAKGAARVFSKPSTEDLLDAMSQLTGVPFRRNKRMPYETVVGVEMGGRFRLRETYELSMSGLLMRGFKGLGIGDKMRLHFDQLESPLVISALVVRRVSPDSRSLVALAFENLSSIDRERLRRLVKTLENARKATEIDLSGFARVPPKTELSMPDLAYSASPHYLEALSARLEHPKRPTQRLPQWLTEVAASLSEPEKARLLAGPFALDGWPAHAIWHRLALAQSTAEHGEHGPQQQVQDLLRFCLELGAVAQKEPGEMQAVAVRVRGQLIRALFQRSTPSRSR